MHIPDGYLAPAFSLGTGVITVPIWAIATRRAKQVLNNRTVPLLAIFSAFSFTIMMFNVPVPGGTTAHGVGGTLMAIVLGPWAATIGVSTALIIQALFFGDGGILAIFANCLNMGIILPFVGYYSYRLLAARAPLLSGRRVWAAGIGAYIGITVSAVAVGVELGLQPVLFTSNGHPMYSPYPIQAAVPAMLIAHVFGASLVEALITSLCIAYLQKRHPEYLAALRGVVAPSEVAVGTASRVPLWQVITGSVAAAVIALGALGLITGGGNPAHLFGADWSGVDWPAVASMLGLVVVLGIILIPLAYLVLPQRIKRIGTAFVAVAIIAPLGLIAPGFAYGEGSAQDVQQAFGYVPEGLQKLSTVFSAPLSGYNLPLPFFNGSDAPLWRAAIGYEISGIIGILLLGLIVMGIGYLITGRGRETSGSLPSGNTSI